MNFLISFFVMSCIVIALAPEGNEPTWQGGLLVVTGPFIFIGCMWFLVYCRERIIRGCGSV
jgi:hypothetical protein